MKTILWIIGEWITGLPCRFGLHDFEDWNANTYRGRVFFDWTRNCRRCGKMEAKSVGENPDGLTHPGTLY